MLPPLRKTIVAGAAASLILKTYIALRTVGTNDVLTFERFVHVAEHDGGLKLYVYYDPPRLHFNHPPFMIHVLRILDWVAQTTNLPFPFWLRFPGIAADIGSLVLVWRILEASGRPFSPWALLLVATAPASIMISGFHGNTDPMMMFFLLLSIYLIVVRDHVALAGVAMGISASIKIMPVLFLPAVLLHLPGLRQRVIFSLLAAATGFCGSLPYIVQAPTAIYRRVFGYSSIYGQWGLTRLLGWLADTPLQPLDALVRAHGSLFLLILILLLSIRLNERSPESPLFWQCGLIGTAILAMTPGFGVQYLAWVIPWTAVANLPTAVAFHVATGSFLFAVYTYWSRGLPWYLADSFALGASPWGPLIPLEMACWVSVVVLLCGLWKAVYRIQH